MFVLPPMCYETSYQASAIKCLLKDIGSLSLAVSFKEQGSYLVAGPAVINTNGQNLVVHTTINKYGGGGTFV